MDENPRRHEKVLRVKPAPEFYVPRKLKIYYVLAAEEYQMLYLCKSIKVGKINKKLSILGDIAW